MKKTVTANISGTLYNIEDDAFDLMQKYLNSIKMYFSSYEDSEEIFMDFENRISENLYSISNNANDVINSKHVAKIIEIMGKPCLLYTSPSPRDMRRSRMPSSA